MWVMMNLTTKQLESLGYKLNNIYKVFEHTNLKPNITFTFQDLFELAKENIEEDREEGEERKEDKKLSIPEIKSKLKIKGIHPKRIFGTRDQLLDLLNTDKNIFDEVPNIENGDSPDDVEEFFINHPNLRKRTAMRNICEWRGLTYNKTGDEEELLLTLKNATRIGNFLDNIQEIPIHVQRKLTDMTQNELFDMCISRNIDVKKSYSKKKLLKLLE